MADWSKIAEANVGAPNKKLAPAVQVESPPTQPVPPTSQQPDPDAALAFLDRFFGDAQRPLQAIEYKVKDGKKVKVTPKAKTFAATDRDGPRELILKYNANHDVYYAELPLETTAMTKRSATSPRRDGSGLTWTRR